jgi:acyl-CoA synthetase (AMP-forming)/AMP-acid ligase II
MLRRIADLPARPDEDTSSLLAVVSSGATLPAATAQACRERFGRPVVTVYGSSDGVNCHTAGESHPPGDSVGTPDPAVARIRITGPDGTPLPTGRTGQIEALGPMTPLCYVNAPQLDARYRTSDGWVRTGDLGRLDEYGRLHVLGRLKRIAVRGGLNISLAEVERELGTHPAVAEAVCVPVPDPDLGERLCACIRPAPCTPVPTLSDLTTHLAGRGLARRKHPEHLLILNEMPLGPTGEGLLPHPDVPSDRALRSGNTTGRSRLRRAAGADPTERRLRSRRRGGFPGMGDPGSADPCRGRPLGGWRAASARGNRTPTTVTKALAAPRHRE